MEKYFYIYMLRRYNNDTDLKEYIDEWMNG